MSDSTAKTITLKLKSPRVHAFMEALLLSSEHGWKRTTTPQKFHGSGRLGGMSITTLQKEVQLVEGEPTQYEWNCRLDTIPPSFYWPVSSQEAIVDIAVKESTVVATPTPKVAVEPPQEPEKRPYTLEELQAMKWVQIQKLSALYGNIEGTRPEREAIIVAKSQEVV